MLAIVFASEWAAVIALVEGISGLAVLAGLYRFAECHQEGCHRFGRFRHEHLRLCHRHHPLVPDDGQIDVSRPA